MSKTKNDKLNTLGVKENIEIFAKLEAATYDDPFAFLGPQYGSTEYALKVWMPGAHAVALKVKDHLFPMEQHQAGYLLKSEALPAEFDLTKTQYELQINWGDQTQTFVDPYQFHNIYPNQAALNDPISQFREMGAQLIEVEQHGQTISGTRFTVYAPHATSVAVIGDFNAWDGRRSPMQCMDDGLWGIFIPNLAAGERYKFEIHGPDGALLPHKADPWGYQAEQYPSFSSVVVDQNSYQWNDKKWQDRENKPKHTAPLSFYELHTGSWRRDENGEFLTYRQLADQLVPYLVDMNYTHVELLPVSEYPFYGSWGYQPVGLFAPTSRFGDVDDFKYFVDQCHQAGIGIILDWVPAHFPADSHGLANFDGTPLFNDPDPRRGWHQDWSSFIYDYEREHVRRFLVSNALFWLEHYHIDGLRVDAVASMLYLDYSREDGEWIPNMYGGNVNLAAKDMLEWMNIEVYKHFPKAMTIAEESTAYPGVSKPIDLGGLGFGFKWNMGWMHDSLEYFSKDPVYRKWEHNTITFPMIYAFSENYVLSLSHDEVVYGKGSIINKMPGDEWQQAANARAYYGYMYAMPGKKLNFMGNEFAQSTEWGHNWSLDWYLLQYPKHKGMQNLMRELNKLYCNELALHELDTDPAGFEWRIGDDSESSILVWERLSEDGERIMCVSNLTPAPREIYRIGVPKAGSYKLLLNSDDEEFWGSNYEVFESVKTTEEGDHGQDYSIELSLPPLSTMFYKYSKY